jgi:hypothetical protein
MAPLCPAIPRGESAIPGQTPLSFARHFAHNHAMENQPGPPRNFKELVRWAGTKPQVYVVYLIGLILVWAVSFYAGTLNPKRTLTSPPPPVSAPQR